MLVRLLSQVCREGNTMNSITCPGEKELAACEKCQKFTQVTWNYGPVTFEELVVEQVMRATCDTCGEVVGTAHQSSYLFKKALRQQRQHRTTIRLPQELRDYLSLQLDRAGASVFQPEIFLRALLAACRGCEETIGQALRTIEDPVLLRPCSEVLTLTLRTPLKQTLTKLHENSGVPGVSELIRRLLVLSDTEEFYPKLKEETDRVMLAMAG